MPGRFFMKYLFLIISVFQSCMAFTQMQLSPSFGTGGVVKISLDDFTEPVGILKLNDDSLLLLSNVTQADTLVTTDFAITKLTPDGGVDIGFGQNGSLRYDFKGMEVSAANSFLVLDDAKILVLGTGHSLANDSFLPACLMKLFPNGHVDSAFGNNGTLNLQFDGIQEFPRIIKKAAGNKIIVGGFSTDSMHTHVDVPAIARMNENGTLDSTFGDKGKTYLRFPNGIISASRHTVGGVLYDVLELSNGTYLASGGYSNGLNLIGFITHLNHDGSIDTGFFSSGYMAVDFTPYSNSQIIKMKEGANGLIWFGATSAATQGKDFFTGNLNISTGDYNVAPIDFNGNEDNLADIQVDANGNSFFIGKTSLPQHTSGAYQSDYFAINFSPAATFPFSGQQFIFSEDTTLQSGAVSSIMQTNGDLICYGFKNKPDGRSELMLIAVNVSEVLSVDDTKAEETFIRVFPNPSNGIINVLSNGSEPITELLVTDIMGREMIALINTSFTSWSFDISNLARGAYILKGKSAGRSFFSKVVLQ